MTRFSTILAPNIRFSLYRHTQEHHLARHYTKMCLIGRQDSINVSTLGDHVLELGAGDEEVVVDDVKDVYGHVGGAGEVDVRLVRVII